MDKLTARRRFIVNFAYWAIIAAIAYLVFRYLLNLLLPFIIALLVAALLRPLSKLYIRKMPKHRKLASALTVATVLLFYLLIGTVVMLFLANLIMKLIELVGRLPAYYTQSIEPGLRDLYVKAQTFAARFDPAVTNAVNQILPQVISSVSGAVTSFSVTAVGKLTSFAAGVPSFLLSAVISVIATIFTAVAFDSMKAFLKRNLPSKFTETASYVIRSFRNIIGQYGRSYLLVMLITFGEITLGLLIIGIRRAFLIAALIAIFDIFPIVGAGLILLPWAIITLVQGSLWQGAGLLILYVVVIVVRQFLEPKLVGKQVGLPPLVTLACMFVGSSLFGVWGLFGFPITAAILVNLTNDPDVPIRIFRTAPAGGGAAEPMKIRYRFRKRGEAAEPEKPDPEENP